MDVIQDLIQKLEKVRASYGRLIQKDDLGLELSDLNEKRDNIVAFLSGEEEEIAEIKAMGLGQFLSSKHIQDFFLGHKVRTRSILARSCQRSRWI